MLSTGAIDYADPGNDTIEPYSGWGPTNDGRTKPDVTGIDGVSVTGNGGFPANFFGTSATSEEAGAIAALILSCVPPLRSGETGDNPVADRTTLRNAILNSSIDLGTAGIDNTFGHGRLNAQAAAAAAGCTTQQVTLGGADLDGRGGGVRNSLADRLAMPATITGVLLLAGALQFALYRRRRVRTR